MEYYSNNNNNTILRDRPRSRCRRRHSAGGTEFLELVRTSVCVRRTLLLYYRD